MTSLDLQDRGHFKLFKEQLCQLVLRLRTISIPRIPLTVNQTRCQAGQTLVTLLYPLQVRPPLLWFRTFPWHSSTSMKSLVL